MFDLRQLLARPGMPLQAIIVVSTSPDKVMEIDRGMWEAQKDNFISFCASIPDIEVGPSYQVLKCYTGQNGDLAKLLIALGELAGVWRVHPPLQSPELWGKSRLYPMVQASAPRARTVPKLSTGDLHKGESPCVCCTRPTGPAGSRVHDLVAGEREGYCSECDEAGCDADKPCNLDKPTAAVRKKVAVEEDEDADPDGLTDYLKSFGSKLK